MNIGFQAITYISEDAFFYLYLLPRRWPPASYGISYCANDNDLTREHKSEAGI